MPLAIYAALESDTRIAVALSLTLASMGALLLFALRTTRVSRRATGLCSNPRVRFR